MADEPAIDDPGEPNSPTSHSPAITRSQTSNNNEYPDNLLISYSISTVSLCFAVKRKKNIGKKCQPKKIKDNLEIMSASNESLNSLDSSPDGVISPKTRKITNKTIVR